MLALAFQAGSPNIFQTFEGTRKTANRKVHFQLLEGHGCHLTSDVGISSMIIADYVVSMEQRCVETLWDIITLQSDSFLVHH